MIYSTQNQIRKYNDRLGEFLVKTMMKEKEIFLKRIKEMENITIETDGLREYFDTLSEIYQLSYKYYKSMKEKRNKDDFEMFLQHSISTIMFHSLPFGHIFFLTHSQETIDEENQKNENIPIDIEDIEEGMTFFDIKEIQRLRINRKLIDRKLKICVSCFTCKSFDDYYTTTKGNYQGKCKECQRLQREINNG